MTTVVVADNVTGAMWGGVYGDPTSRANTDRLIYIREISGNQNYDIMSFDKATELENK